MNRILTAGILACAVGLVGYVVGVVVPYPGRSFSVSLVMVGTTVAAIGRATAGETA